MGRRKRRQPFKVKIRKETIQSVVAVVLFTLGILVMISFTGQGEILTALNQYLALKIGLGTLFVPFVFVSSGLVMLRTQWAWSKPHVLLGTLLLMFGTMGVMKSGTIGMETFANMAVLLSPLGSYVFFGSLIFIGLLIITQFSLHEILQAISRSMAAREKAKREKLADGQDEVARARGFHIPRLNLFGSKSDQQSFQVNSNDHLSEIDPEATLGTAVDGGDKPSSQEQEATDQKPSPQPTGAADPLAEGSPTHNTRPLVWEYPPLSLLSDQAGGTADRGDVKANAAIIESTLESFGIRARVTEVNNGPSVTQYALNIAQGTKLSRITSLSTDLALALAAPTGQIRVEAPIAGRSLVGIEVPNKTAQFVTLRKMLSSPLMKQQKSKIAVALGIDVSGQPVMVDIAKMPHMLIAGATGSGKSVAINTFLCSILFRASPNEVKLILVDPKRVELTGYNGIPHLLTPVIVEPKKVISALRWALKEMDDRYKKLSEVGVKNLEGYNELAGFAAMPNIVIIIDEMADVMMFAPGDVEEAVTRLAQMARAVGIHLVLATQRPSVDVITGLIKANIPSRIAFNVSSMADSRVILDTPGAEKLLGRGDMLFTPPDQAKPSRIQGTFVSEAEAKALVDFIKSQGEQPEYEQDITTKFVDEGSGLRSLSGDGGDDEDRDNKFEEAVKLISQSDKASSSLLQRRLSVGYARAARILDQLHEAGLVGPADGSKPREVNMGKIREYLASLESGN